ncbi:MAG: hypothetical protein ACI9A7_001040 [Cyclobacteriaceae bacterium]|jgi:hypothetical protein
MVFTEIDKETATIISTLVKYVNNSTAHHESIITVGQHLGVPKDETIGIIEEWEESDSLTLQSTSEKKEFIKEIFQDILLYDDHLIKQLHSHISKELGITS